MGTPSNRIALYPGTFDPVTNGHISLIRRGSQLFDEIVVTVAIDTPKTPLFTIDERVEMLRESVRKMPNVRVEPFAGLLVDYAVNHNISVILRGLRAVSDFEYEFQLALMNRRLQNQVQTLFLMTEYRWLYISSTMVKSAASLGGNIQGLVPNNVYRRLRERYGYPVDPITSPIESMSVEDPE